MLIGLRDKNGKLKVKDILDLNMDMSVEKDGLEYLVKITKSYYLDNRFDNEADAEAALYNIANIRNEMELQEL
jgi:hypothetical protein